MTPRYFGHHPILNQGFSAVITKLLTPSPKGVRSSMNDPKLEKSLARSILLKKIFYRIKKNTCWFSIAEKQKVHPLKYLSAKQIWSFENEFRLKKINLIEKAKQINKAFWDIF